MINQKQKAPAQWQRPIQIIILAFSQRIKGELQ